MRPNLVCSIVLLASVVGFAFSAVSAHDSVAHLDRQIHGIHCSYLPGLDAADATGSSGCYATLMSPYSSVLRESIWGGVPVAIPSMSVFAFIFFWAAWMLVAKRQTDSMAAGFLLAASALPFLSSVVMAYISFLTLDAACKLCIGIYGASTAAILAAAVAYFAARKGGDGAQSGVSKLSWGALTSAFGLGVVFVAVPFVAYTAMAPDYSHFIGNCGALTYPHDSQRVLVPLGPQDRDNEIVEILDPLCVACAGFERRFEAMPISKETRRKVLLFPLDSTCNWMVDEAIHPGACSVSEAVLCAEEDAEKVMEWAFENREEILAEAKIDPKGPSRMIVARFPELRRCVGSPGVRARLNLALRWAVKNQLQVLTPQVYVQGMRLCDEDSDIGLDYALPRLIARAKTLPAAKTPVQESPRPTGLLPAPTPGIAPEKPTPSLDAPAGSPGGEEAGEAAAGETGGAVAAPEGDKEGLDALIEKAKERAAEHAGQAMGAEPGDNTGGDKPADNAEPKPQPSAPPTVPSPDSDSPGAGTPSSPPAPPADNVPATQDEPAPKEAP